MHTIIVGGKKIARYLSALVAAVALCSGCSATQYPISDQARYPISDQSEYYQINIGFQYKGKEYHERWINRCDRFGPDILSRWKGFAKALPDGSAVFFKMRGEPCIGGALTWLLFGPPIADDLWQNAGAAHNGWKSETQFSEAAARNRQAYTTPVVYWLDSAIKPKSIELCALPQCALSPTARVRILSISGARSTLHKVSTPEAEIPALKSITDGPDRFVGYACWVIPMAAIRPEHRFPASKIISMTSGPDRTGDVRFDFIANELAFQATGGVKQELPLMNSWIGVDIRQAGVHNILDSSQLDDPLYYDLERPLDEWARTCYRSGDAIILGTEFHRGDTIAMKSLPLLAKSPRKFILHDGKQLDGGPGSPNDPDLLEKYLAQEPNRLSSATIDDSGYIYIAEALTFSVDVTFSR